MKIIHALFSDKDNCIYCKKINSLLKIIPFKTLCLNCSKFRGTIQGEGCECEWDDFDFNNGVAIYNHIAEYDCVNNFKKSHKRDRLKIWNKENEEAKNLYNNCNKTLNLWSLLREFSGLIKADKYDALSYMGTNQELCFDDDTEISEEFMESF